MNATVKHEATARLVRASDGAIDSVGRPIMRPACSCGAEMKWDGDVAEYFCPEQSR